MLLVDSSETLASIRRGGFLDEASASVVAVSKRGLSACAREQLAYTTVESYYSRDALIASSLARYDDLRAFCDKYDQVLAESLVALRQRGIKPLSYSFYELKILTDTIAAKVHQGQGLLRRAGSDGIVYRRDCLASCQSDDLTFDEAANVFGLVLEHLCRCGYADSATLRPIDVPRPRHSRYPRARLFQRAIAALRRFRAAAPKTGARHAHYFLLFYGGHDVTSIAPALAEAGYRPRRIPTSDLDGGGPLVADAEEAWQRLHRDSGFQKFFTIDGADYFPLVESRLRHLVARTIPRAVAAYDRTVDVMQRHGAPAFSLTAAVHLGAVQRSIMRAAQDAGAPLVSYQEGAGFGSVEHPMNDYAEVPDGDLFLCYGRGNVEYRDALVRRGHSVKPFVAVGSAKLDQVRSGLRRSAPPDRVASVMFVTGYVQTNRQHHPYNGFTDTAFRRSQLAVIRSFEDAPSSIRTFVKPHPSDLLGEDLTTSLRRCVEVLDGVLEDHLDRADLFVIDFPSTTLLACCLTHAHIFVLAEPGVTKLEGPCLEALRRRARVFFDVDTLVEELHAVFHGKRLDPLNDDEYLRLYGTYLDDGRSAERAVNELIKLSSNRSRARAS